MFTIPGFAIHPVNLDIDANVGRGLAIYTHSSLNGSVIQIKPKLKFEEACLLEIRLKGGDMMLFGCFYRSPTLNDTSEKNNKLLNQLLKSLSQKQYTHKCLVGDFNYRDINWNTWTTNHNEDSKEHHFIETIRDCYLHQHNTEDSRRRGNDQPSLIDLIFSDEEMQVSEVQHHAPLGKSDHNVITFTFNCYIDFSKSKERYLYNKADYVAMRRELEASKWMESLNLEHSIEGLWNKIKEKTSELRKKFVPAEKVSGKPSWKDVGSTPIDKKVQEAIKMKHVTHRRWMNAKRHGSAAILRKQYVRTRNKVTNMLRKARRKFEQNIANNSKANPKVFWSH